MSDLRLSGHNVLRCVRQPQHCPCGPKRQHHMVLDFGYATYMETQRSGCRLKGSRPQPHTIDNLRASTADVAARHEHLLLSEALRKQQESRHEKSCHAYGRKKSMITARTTAIKLAIAVHRDYRAPILLTFAHLCSHCVHCVPFSRSFSL